MKELIRFIKADFRNIVRDPMLLLILLLPALLGPLVRLLIPAGADFLKVRFGVDASPFIPMIFSIMILLPAVMGGTVCGFLLLEEKESGLLTPLGVVPVNSWILRGGRTLWTILYAWIGAIVFALTAKLIPFTPKILLITALLALEAPVMALVLFRMAKNRIQGLTMAKVLSLVTAAPVTYYIVPGAWKWTAALLPTFWAAPLTGWSQNTLTEAGSLPVPALILHGMLLLLLLSPKGKKRGV